MWFLYWNLHKAKWVNQRQWWLFYASDWFVTVLQIDKYKKKYDVFTARCRSKKVVGLMNGLMDRLMDGWRKRVTAACAGIHQLFCRRCSTDFGVEHRGLTNFYVISSHISNSWNIAIKTNWYRKVLNLKKNSNFVKRFWSENGTLCLDGGGDGMFFSYNSGFSVCLLFRSRSGFCCTSFMEFSPEDYL